MKKGKLLHLIHDAVWNFNDDMPEGEEQFLRSSEIQNKAKNTESFTFVDSDGEEWRVSIEKENNS